MHTGRLSLAVTDSLCHTRTSTGTRESDRCALSRLRLRLFAPVSVHVCESQSIRGSALIYHETSHTMEGRWDLNQKFPVVTSHRHDVGGIWARGWSGSFPFLLSSRKGSLRGGLRPRPHLIIVMGPPLETLRTPSVNWTTLDGEPGTRERQFTVPVMITEELAERITKRLPNTRFKSVDEYLTYIAEGVLTELESQERPVEDPFTKEDQAAVERKLRELGYL
jgi:hypothetical protein